MLLLRLLIKKLAEPRTVQGDEHIQVAVSTNGCAHVSETQVLLAHTLSTSFMSVFLAANAK